MSLEIEQLENTKLKGGLAKLISYEHVFGKISYQQAFKLLKNKLSRLNSFSHLISSSNKVVSAYKHFQISLAKHPSIPVHQNEVIYQLSHSHLSRTIMVTDEIWYRQTTKPLYLAKKKKKRSLIVMLCDPIAEGWLSK